MSWDALTLTGLMVSIIMISMMFYLIIRDRPG
jgi:hypothetical protein